MSDELRARVIATHKLSLWVHAICFVLHISKNFIQIYAYTGL